MFLQSHLLGWEARLHPLRQLFWECTLRCNLNCRHCGSDCTASALTPDMPFEDFEKVLLRIREAYNPKDILVIFSGGEPLMRKDLAQCGRRVHELGFPWGLVTNGFLLTPKKALELLKCGMRAATVSMDGLEDEHDWMRGVPGSFRRADEAIRYLASVSFLSFDVVTCVTKKNIGQLSQIKEYLIGAGVKAWRLFTVFPVGRAAADPDLQLTPEQYRSLMDFIVACRKEGQQEQTYRDLNVLCHPAHCPLKEPRADLRRRTIIRSGIRLRRKNRLRNHLRLRGGGFFRQFRIRWDLYHGAVGCAAVIDQTLSKGQRISAQLPAVIGIGFPQPHSVRYHDLLR